MIYTPTFAGNPRSPVAHSELSEAEVKRRRYAFPEERKFPLTDRHHVLSAIKFFNHVAPKDEKTLADAILKRMEELGMKDVNVGKVNRFRKYIEEPEDELSHHGIKGMHWGVRNAETQARYASRGKQDKQLARVNKSYRNAENEFIRAEMIKRSPDLAKAVGTTPEKAQKKAYKKAEKHKRELAKSARLGTGLSYDISSGNYSVRSYADENVGERKARIDANVARLPKATLKDGTKGIHTMTDTSGKILQVEGFDDRYASKKSKRKAQQAVYKVGSQKYKNNSQRLNAMGETYVRTVLEYEYGLRK